MGPNWPNSCNRGRLSGLLEPPQEMGGAGTAPGGSGAHSARAASIICAQRMGTEGGRGLGVRGSRRSAAPAEKGPEPRGYPCPRRVPQTGGSFFRSRGSRRARSSRRGSEGLLHRVGSTTTGSGTGRRPRETLLEAEPGPTALASRRPHRPSRGAVAKSDPARRPVRGGVFCRDRVRAGSPGGP